MGSQDTTPIGATAEAPSRRGQVRQRVKVRRPALAGAELAAEMHARRAESIDRRDDQRVARQRAREERRARRAA